MSLSRRKLRVIGSHQQLYALSCSSACIELVLKLHCQVSGSYRKIQDSYKNKNIGYGPFRGRWIRNLFFYERSFLPPFTGLEILLSSEVRAGRFPIMSLWSGETIQGNTRFILYHEWIVVDQVGHDFRIVSKNLRQTLDGLVMPALQKSDHTTLLLYTMLS